ncbi:uncharacterized protein LOC118801647 [Colossoma macropomum]|uniref:uncharacterized protein LOC118801647 n=1 Tax=Colossoma macropomum TaxID=42526 RepID=UPI00186527A4|nr:uncharacterized protein LOC118801647 [Colossoma macropomum]
MVCSRVLVGLFLLSVLSSAVEISDPLMSSEIDVHERPIDKALRNLPQIISFLNKNYLVGDQFAVAINVPAEKCSTRVKPDQSFLPDDPALKVKRAMNRPARVYRGRRIIAAKQKMINETSSYHPEYLLLIQSNPPNTTSHDPLLKSLLNKDKHGCVVFYTYNSPCVKSCSTIEGADSILPALDMLRDHKGPKAFVFRKVWKHYVGSSQKTEHDGGWHCFSSGSGAFVMVTYQDYFPQHKANIRAVNAKVPLYRCDGAHCDHCVHSNNEVDVTCMGNF